jgi:hypothetical protein
MDWIVLILVMSFFLVIALITGALAKRKGYAFLPWFFAGGIPIISLITLCFLPFANDPKAAESDNIFNCERGNRIGRNLALFWLVIVLIRAMASA